MATHSSILAWEIPWTDDPGRGGGRGHRPWGHKESDTTEHTHTYTHTRGGSQLLSCIMILCL